MMIFGAFAVFFTGFPHVWSVYQPYVMELTGWEQGQASMCFYLALSTFVFGNIVGGRMQNKKNARFVVFIGGGISALGIIASAFLMKTSPVPVYLTYGILQGLGQGMLYTAIVSTVQKWFPERIGFASGIVVTANGLCGFFLAPVSRTLLESRGVTQTLVIIGMLVILSWILCSIFCFSPDLRNHDQTEQPNKESQYLIRQRQYTSKEMVKTQKFYLLLAIMSFGLMSYFIVSPVSQTYQTSLGIPSSVAIYAVMFGSVLNAAIRLVLPTLGDKVGRVICIKIVIIVSIIAMGLLSVSVSWEVPIAIILIYGCYGGIMGSYPSFTSSIFGIEHTGENYGYVMIGIVLATFGAPLITNVVERQYSMQPVFMVGTFFAVLAFICLNVLGQKLENKNRNIEGAETWH